MNRGFKFRFEVFRFQTNDDGYSERFFLQYIGIVDLYHSFSIIPIIWIRRRSPSLNLPPGPKLWPIVSFLPTAIRLMRGHGMDIHEILGWLGERYGPVS